MNLVTRQIYGLKKGLSGTNTEIGGVSGTITTAQLLADKLQYYPSGLTFSASDIQNFTIIGSDIKCTIQVDYRIRTNAFLNNTAITRYYDYGSKCKELVSNTFNGCSNLDDFLFNGTLVVGQRILANCAKLKRIYFPSLTNLCPTNGGFAGDAFQNSNGIKRLYIPKCTVIGTTTASEVILRSMSGLQRVYADPFLATNNGGSAEGDLTSLITAGKVTYVTDFTPPNAITNLTVSNITTTSIQLNFTPPSSVNAIDFYEVYINDIFNKEITASGQTVTGLTSLTNYKVKVKVADIYFNISAISNSINITTL
jgi:hypothetical protein